MSDVDQSLVASLARAQAKFGPIKKRHTNKHFGSSYADLSDFLDVVRGPLTAEDIALVFPVEGTEVGYELVVALLKSTERMESRFPMPTGLKPQDTLAWLTYMRRGLGMALLGVAADDDDDDGNSAQAAATAEPNWQSGTRFEKTGGTGKLASEKQQKFAGRLMGDVVHMNLHAQYIEDTVGRAAQLEELTTAEMSKLIDKLQDEKRAGRTPEGVYPEGQEPF